MIRLPLHLWGLLGLTLFHSCNAVKGRDLQSNGTSVFVPALFDTQNFDWGEEVSECAT